METSIFDFSDYKVYLKAWLKSRPSGGYGEKSRLAEAIRCHTAYITHIFSGNAHLSLEQASDMSAYLAHNNEEQRFFLLLVQLARAGSPGLEQFFHSEISRILETRLELNHRLKYKVKLSSEDQATFYGAWYYPAIYALVSIPGYQTAEKVAQHFHIHLSKVTDVLDFLVRTQLLSKERGRYKIRKNSVFLGNDSKMIAKHHSCWRIQAIRALDFPSPSDLHYSSVISLSKKDAPKVRAILVKAIEEVRALVAASPEEAVFAYALDFFEVLGR